MQVELFNRRRWKTRIELANAIHDHILFHNTRRRHSALGMRTPSEIEAAWADTGNGVVAQAEFAKTTPTVLVDEGAAARLSALRTEPIEQTHQHQHLNNDQAARPQKHDSTKTRADPDLQETRDGSVAALAHDLVEVGAPDQLALVVLGEQHDQRPPQCAMHDRREAARLGHRVGDLERAGKRRVLGRWLAAQITRPYWKLRATPPSKSRSCEQRRVRGRVAAPSSAEHRAALAACAGTLADSWRR
jgi:hypothetical protein